MADGSVTLGQLAPDALAKIGLDHNPATAEGNLLAVPRGTQPPPDYVLYKRSDRNGTLVWEEKAPLSVGRSLDQIAYLQGKIYAVASGYGTVSNLFERYDVEKNQWESLPNLGEALHGVSVVALGEKIYVIGGENESSQVCSDVRVYDPQTENWSNAAPLPSPLLKTKAIAYGGAIYLINGANSVDYSDNFLKYSPDWAQLANAPFAGDGRKLVVYQDRIWAIGGFNSATPVSEWIVLIPRQLVASRSISYNFQKLANGMGWEWRNLCWGRMDNGAPLNTVEFMIRQLKLGFPMEHYLTPFGGVEVFSRMVLPIWWGVPNQPMYFLTKSTRQTSLRRWICTTGRIVLQAQLLLGS